MGKTFHILIEQDEDGGFIGSVSELKGCHSQGVHLMNLWRILRKQLSFV